MPTAMAFLQTQQVCVQPPTYANNVALPAFACRTLLLQQSIDISCLSGPQQQTCCCMFAPVGLYARTP